MNPARHVAVQDKQVNGAAQDREVRELHHEGVDAARVQQAVKAVIGEPRFDQLISVGLGHDVRQREMPAQPGADAFRQAALYMNDQGVPHVGMAIEALQCPQRTEVIRLAAQEMHFHRARVARPVGHHRRGLQDLRPEAPSLQRSPPALPAQPPERYPAAALSEV